MAANSNAGCRNLASQTVSRKESEPDVVITKPSPGMYFLKQAGATSAFPNGISSWRPSVDWNNQFYKNGCVAQRNLHIRYNPNQYCSNILQRNRNNPSMYMEAQLTLGRQSHPA